ncbi:MAG: hypothetical protein ACREU7_13415 [Burkholderiales bacterium]
MGARDTEFYIAVARTRHLSLPAVVPKSLSAAILELHDDIRSELVVSLKDHRLLEWETRARFNVPPHVRERAGNVWALILHAIGQQLGEYFEPPEFVVFEHGRAWFVALQAGAKYVMFSMRQRLSLSEVPALVARVKALPLPPHG